MCGIAGIFGQNRERLSAMLLSMQTRGPDAMRTERFEHGNYRAALGHVRLSILDLDPRSHQPFSSTCGRYRLTFNGEIYNYVELRGQLESTGVAFHTSSDTEVLLQWLLRHGADGIHDLEGMFAFGLLDTADGSLLLARDHVGEKPLYYASNNANGLDSFAFASETTALLQLPWVDASANPTAMADYLRFLYTPHPNTLYRGIQELPPGCHLLFRPGQEIETPKKFYRMEDEVETAQSLSYEEAVAGFREQFVESVRLRLQSDVPVGLFLSGGLDSNAILSAAKQLGVIDQLKAYTIGYDQQGAADGDESPLAREAANHFGIQHHVSNFAGHASLEQTVDRALSMFGQPYGNATALAAEAISGQAARRSRVCLVGDGGDELLNGYPRHRAIGWAQTLNKWVGPLGGPIHAVASRIPTTGKWEIQIDRMKRLTETLQTTPGESFLRWTTFLRQEEIERGAGLRCDSGFYESLLELFARHEDTPLLAASLVDLHSFVPCKLMHCSDRAGMAHSLELRCPFLAPPLIRYALTLPERHKMRGRRVKPLLADAFEPELPPFVKKQPKRPFNPPMRRYLRTHIATIHDLLINQGSPLTEILGPEFVQGKLDEFKSRRRDHSTLLWGLLVLNRWLSTDRNWLRQPEAA